MTDEQTIDEQIIYEGKIPVKTLLATQGSLMNFLLFGWNIGLLKAWMNSKRVSLKITSQRIEFVTGLMGTAQESVELYRANDTDYSQTFLQKMFGVGSLRILSADSTAPLIVFPIADPAAHRDKIRNAIMAERKRMGTTLRESE